MAALKQPREVRELDPDGRLSELRDWECWARDVLHCKLVRTEADLHNDATTFHPVYTHQRTRTPCVLPRSFKECGLCSSCFIITCKTSVFDDEKIRGYRGLHIELFFSASDLFAYIHIDYESRHDSTYDDVQEIILKRMSQQKGAVTHNLKEFVKVPFLDFPTQIVPFSFRIFSKTFVYCIPYHISTPVVFLQHIKTHNQQPIGKLMHSYTDRDHTSDKSTKEEITYEIYLVSFR
jgi:hypothetical protein